LFVRPTTRATDCIGRNYRWNHYHLLKMFIFYDFDSSFSIYRPIQCNLFCAQLAICVSIIVQQGLTNEWPSSVETSPHWYQNTPFSMLSSRPACRSYGELWMFGSKLRTHINRIGKQSLEDASKVLRTCSDDNTQVPATINSWWSPNRHHSFDQSCIEEYRWRAASPRACSGMSGENFLSVNFLRSKISYIISSSRRAGVFPSGI
jgi:hypothetical protein